MCKSLLKNLKWLLLLTMANAWDVEHCRLLPEGLVNCSDTGLTKVPMGIPLNTTNLDLTFNQIKILFSGDFENLLFLKYLNISINPIHTINSHVFKGLTNLLVLNMDGHNLSYSNTSLPCNVFQPLTSLTNLSFRSDLKQFKNLETFNQERVFWPLSNLRSLSLDTCAKTVFNSYAANLVNLEELYIGGVTKYGVHFPCGLNKLKNNTFEAFSNISIRVLYLSECEIDELENGFLVSLPNLKHFLFSSVKFLSDYNIKDVAQALSTYRGKNITEINLANLYYNSYYWVGMNIAFPIEIIKDICVEKLDVSYANIDILDVDNLFMEYPLPPILTCLKFFYMKRNKIGGNSSFISLYLSVALSNIEVMDGSMQRIYYYDAFLSRVKPLYKISSQLPVPIVAFCPKNVRYINLAGSIHIGTLFDLYLFRCNNLLYLNISYTDMNNLNSSVHGLTNLRVFDLSRNDLHTISPGFFQTLTTLRELYLKDVGFQDDVMARIGNQLFRPLTLLEILDLSHNSFQVLPKNLFDSLVSLTTLNLAYNELVSLPEITSLIKLDLLFMNHNSLLGLNRSETDVLERKYHRNKKFKISLQGNFFSCNCEALPFLFWINETKVNIDGGKYSCLDMTGTLTNTINIHERIEYYNRLCRSSFWLTFSIACWGFIIIFLLTTFLVIKNKMKVHIFIQRFLGRFVRPSKREEFLYDVFVIYSDSIYRWVCYEMLSQLETNKKMKLNIRHRNQPYGIFEADYISDSIRESWKIIFILTQDILDNDMLFFNMYSCLTAMKMSTPNKIILLIDSNVNIQANIGFFIEAILDENVIYVDFRDSFTWLFWNNLERLILKVE